MKTINIKGKEYITVNERLIYFRNQANFKGWQIIETIVSIDDKEGIFKVSLFNDKIMRLRARTLRNTAIQVI